MGKGFLILDGTPLDGSRTIFSDGGKLTLDLDQTTVDFLALWETPGSSGLPSIRIMSLLAAAILRDVWTVRRSVSSVLI